MVIRTNAEAMESVQAMLADMSAEDIARAALAENCRRSFSLFVRHAWHVIEPAARLRWNWHIDVVCSALEAVSRGQIRKLIINMPPGHMKSILVSAMWPAWEWTWAPHTRSLFGSYSQDLANRDSQKTRALVMSPWFQRTFTPGWHLAGDQNVKSNFENTEKGFRMAVSVGGGNTGFRGSKVVVDDPIKQQDAHSEGARRDSFEWWTKTMPTRVDDPATGAFVIVMQRQHEEDLSGQMLAAGGYAHLCLPSIYDPETACACGQKPCRTGPLGKLDRRTQAGELLFPSMFTREVLEELKGPAALGPVDFAAQHQQFPVSVQSGTEMFRRESFQFLDAVPADVVGWVRKWDLAATDARKASDPDWTVGLLMGRRKDGGYVVADVIRRRLDPGDVEALLKSTAELDTTTFGRKVAVHLPQDPGQAGKSQAAAFTRLLAGFIVETDRETGDKTTRARPVSAQCKVGNVKLVRGHWNAAFITEIEAFPRAGVHDDQVDALSGAFNFLAPTRDTATKLRAAMAAW